MLVFQTLTFPRHGGPSPSARTTRSRRRAWLSSTSGRALPFSCQLIQKPSQKPSKMPVLGETRYPETSSSRLCLDRKHSVSTGCTRRLGRTFSVFPPEKVPRQCLGHFIIFEVGRIFRVLIIRVTSQGNTGSSERKEHTKAPWKEGQHQPKQKCLADDLW